MTTLIDLLTLEDIGPDRFRGWNGRDGWVSVYGGQIVGQALAAAARTVAPDRPAHSLHAYFLRACAFDVPIEFTVERDRDGGSFSSRRVVAFQEGRAILTLSASFHTGERNVERLAPMPGVPPPEDMPLLQDIVGEGSAGVPGAVPAIQRPMELIEIRPIDGFLPLTPQAGTPDGRIWFRAVETLGDDRVMHRNALAYASDLFLMSVLIRPHRDEITSGMVTSLDHALWFHEDCRSDEWMLYDLSSARTGQGRGHSEGRVFSRDGRHIATVVQEGLIRTL